jgi:hypothetical protein
VQRQHLYAWPAGSQIDFQTREETWNGLLMTGLLTLYSDGLGSSAELEPWTYFEIPAGMKHKLACDPAASCIFQASFADPHNEVVALASKGEIDPGGSAPFLLHLKQNFASLPKQGSIDWPTAISKPFFWGIGFASLVRYPKGSSALMVNPELYNSGLVLEGVLAIEVDGVPAEPLHAGGYYAIPTEVSYRISCRTGQCLVVARRFKGDEIRELGR